MTKNLVLTGMMGVGKTTIGKSLAQSLSYNFIDIDKLIEEKEDVQLISFLRIKVRIILEKLKA